MEVELPGGWTPAERWMSVDQNGFVTLLAKDTQGVWHEQMDIYRTRDRGFHGSDSWYTLSEAPDLTGFQQGLW